MRTCRVEQSERSVHAQILITDKWCRKNHIETIASFFDAGKSGRTFRRQGYQDLKRYLNKHHQSIDFIVVGSFDRLSRNAGEALIEIEQLHSQYGIKIIDAQTGSIFPFKALTEGRRFEITALILNSQKS